MFDGMSKVLKNAEKIEDNNARAKYITSYCDEMQTNAFEDGKKLLNDVIWYQNKNSNSFKIERNPETHQMTGKQVVIPPMNITLNATKYKNVPEVPNQGFQLKLPFT